MIGGQSTVSIILAGKNPLNRNKEEKGVKNLIYLGLNSFIDNVSKTEPNRVIIQ